METVTNPVTHAAYESWTETARQRRREHALGTPFHKGLIPPDSALTQRVAKAAAVALVGYVARRPVSVHFGRGSSFADTENGLVNLDPSLLEDPDDLGAFLDQLAGLAAHEGAHLRWTRKLSRKTGRLYQWIHNVLEDERIERLLVRRSPALADPLSATRRRLLRVDPGDPRMLSALFCLVRAPERMTEGMWRRHQDFLCRVIGLLSPYPRSGKALRQAVWEVIALLPKAVREQELPPLLTFACQHDHEDDFGADDDLFGLRARALREKRKRWYERTGRVERYPRVMWREPTPDAAGYEAVRREVMRDARRFAECLRPLLPLRAVPQARRGTLDRRRLHAWRYDGRLFENAGVRDDRMVLALVLDLSGSMRGPSARMAQRLAVAVVEGAALLPGVRLYVYGHTADSGDEPSTEIVRFASPAHGRVEGLGRLPVLHNNRDAHALEVIGRDLMAREGPRRGPRMAMVLCDGMPEAKGFRGRAAVEATRRSLRWFEQVWGPPLLVLTQDSPTLKHLAPPPHFTYSETDPMPVLVQAMAHKLRGGRFGDGP